MLVSALDNFCHTYLAIGKGNLGSKIHEFQDFAICDTPNDFAVGNFSILRRYSDEALERITSIANYKSQFMVYALPGALSDPEYEIFRESGFIGVHKLFCMACEEDTLPERIITGGIKLLPAENNRQEIALFAAEIFFSRQGKEIVDRVSHATTQSGLPLYEIQLNNQRIGAVMLVEHGGSLGVYNLCILPDYRGRSLGKIVLQQLKVLGVELHRTLTLQCDYGLQKWYKGCNFQTIGSIEVLVLDR